MRVLPYAGSERSKDNNSGEEVRREVEGGRKMKIVFLSLLAMGMWLIGYIMGYVEGRRK